MKIIFVSSPSGFAAQLKNSLSGEGLDIFYLNDRVNNVVPPPFKNNKQLWRLVRRIRPLKRLSNRIFNERLVNMARKVRPKLVLINKGMIVKPNYLLILKSMGIKTANWFPENVNNEPYSSWVKNNAKFYDYFFSFDSAVEEKNSPGSATKFIYLPFGVEPSAYETEATEKDLKKYSTNVCFIGALYPEREKMLNSIKYFGLKIFGWKDWKNSSLSSFYGGPLSIEDSAKAYRCAKICINMNLEPSTRGVNFKTFEIIAAKGFEMSDYRRDIDGLFEVGKEIEVFHNENELKNKIIRYLKNDSARNKMAQAGYKRLVKDHTLKSRVRQILNSVNL